MNVDAGAYKENYKFNESSEWVFWEVQMIGQGEIKWRRVKWVTDVLNDLFKKYHAEWLQYLADRGLFKDVYT